MAEWKVWADVGKNRMYIVLSGYFSDEQAKMAVDVVVSTAQKLKPGFDCITDLTTHKPGSAVGVAETKRAQRVLVQCGVKRVIRVVTSSTLSKMQFERTGKEAGYRDNMLDVALSLQEADRKLEQSD